MADKYFSLDIAQGDVFFDRDQERARLQSNLLNHTHTLVTSPRRYGKTSLIQRVIEENHWDYARADMLLASDAKKLELIFLDAISRVSSHLAKGKEKLLQLIKKCFYSFSILETVELGQIKLNFQPTLHKPSELVILEALERLDELAKQLDRTIVLFLDEYQHVLTLPSAFEFETALRTFAQHTKNLIFVFSGSNRHMLEAMFGDRSRPFYSMCDHLQLQRISREDYQQHLSQLAIKTWKNKLEDNALNLILDLTERHAYYVNALCEKLWRKPNPPTPQEVQAEWTQLSAEKRYEVSHDFEKLTPLQRNIMIELAREPFSKPQSIEVLTRLQSSSSGVSHAIGLLLKQNYIQQDPKTSLYTVLNPMMAFTLRSEILHRNL